MFPFFRFILFNPGVFSWKFLVGVCCPVLQILTLLQAIFETGFETWPLRNCHHYNYPFSDQTGAKTIPSSGVKYLYLLERLLCNIN